jgi:tetratricopeptide (TPR) repeat protein
MFKIIQSFIAQRNWIKAHALMAKQFHGLALDTIRKAVEIEPDEEKVPQYLELQGNIELSIGKKQLALKTFKSAKTLINKLQKLDLTKIERRIDESIMELEKGEED